MLTDRQDQEEGEGGMYSYKNSTKELSDAGIDTAIIPVGATEQCGPHLPLHLDTLVADYYARAYGELLHAYVLPTLPFNTSEEHSAFKGTISLRPATVMLVLDEIVAGLRAQGFHKQVLVVGHGGSYWVGPFIKDVNRQYRDIIVVNGHSGAGARWTAAVERAGLGGRDDIHGGALSRALALYLAPDAVTAGDYGRDVPDEFKAYMDYCTWDKLTPDGSWGRYTDAGAGVATAEAGRILLSTFVAAQGEYLTMHLREACRIKGIEP